MCCQLQFMFRRQQHCWSTFSNNKLGTVIISHFNYVSNVDYFLNIKPKRWFKSGEQQIGMKFICKVRCHHNNQAFCVRMYNAENVVSSTIHLHTRAFYNVRLFRIHNRFPHQFVPYPQLCLVQCKSSRILKPWCHWNHGVWWWRIRMQYRWNARALATVEMIDERNMSGNYCYWNFH